MRHTPIEPTGFIWHAVVMREVLGQPADYSTSVIIHKETGRKGESGDAPKTLDNFTPKAAVPETINQEIEMPRRCISSR
jgi:hypothetical protein